MSQRERERESVWIIVLCSVLIIETLYWLAGCVKMSGSVFIQILNWRLRSLVILICNAVLELVSIWQQKFVCIIKLVSGWTDSWRVISSDFSWLQVIQISQLAGHLTRWIPLAGCSQQLHLKHFPFHLLAAAPHLSLPLSTVLNS